MDKLCKPKEFQLQEHQRFFKDALTSLHKRMLLFHGLGSGKTCSAISIVNAFINTQRQAKKSAKVLIITPASIKPNIYKEMMGPCGATQFAELRNQPKRSMPDIIDKLVTVMSYQEFVNKASRGEIDLKNTLMIIDEVQNIISATGTMYKRFLYECVHNPRNHNDDLRLILLSGTPIFDQPFEIALLGNLLRTKKESLHMPTDFVKFHHMYRLQSDGTITNHDKLARFFKGRLSYFRGADPSTYPRRRNHDVMCVMHPFQYKVYDGTMGGLLCGGRNFSDISQCFLIGPRLASNVVYPNGKIDVKSAEYYHKKGFDPAKHSCKFNKCLEHIQHSQEGTIFVYSNFVRACGIDTFAHLLEQRIGYSQFTDNVQLSDTRMDGKRFAIFRTGAPKDNTRILEVFNSYENRDGKLIKVILGSPAMKEGVTLLRVSQVHLLDPYWNHSREEQVIGRAIRFCSHKDMPLNKQVVDVYKYYAVHGTKNTNSDMTIDLHVRGMNLHKQEEIAAFERVLKESAVDCHRFKRFNQPPVITCRFGNANNNNQNNVRRNANANNLPDMSVSMIAASRRRATNTGNPNTTALRVIKTSGTVRRIGKQGSSRTKVPGGSRGCPKARRPNPDCPTAYPYKRLNKHNRMCCYKRGKKNEETQPSRGKQRPCVARFTKDALKTLAREKGVYTEGPSTKRRLCELLNLV